MPAIKSVPDDFHTAYAAPRLQRCCRRHRVLQEGRSMPSRYCGLPGPEWPPDACLHPYRRFERDAGRRDARMRRARPEVAPGLAGDASPVRGAGRCGGGAGGCGRRDGYHAGGRHVLGATVYGKIEGPVRPSMVGGNAAAPCERRGNCSRRCGKCRVEPIQFQGRHSCFKVIGIVIAVLIAGVLIFAMTKPDTFRVGALDRHQGAARRRCSR